MKTEPRRVQLEGKELDTMARLTNRVEGDLLKFAERVLTYLYGKSHGLRVKSLRVVPNNLKIAVMDEKRNVIGVWENPPGVCRRPRRGEKFD